MDGKQKNLGLCEKTLQGNFTLNFAPYDNFLSALGSSVVLIEKKYERDYI